MVGRGPKLQALCVNGHDYAVTRRPLVSGRYYCIECQKKRSVRYRKNPDNSEQVRKWVSVSARRSRYGIETDQLMYLVREQEERCAICSNFLPADPYKICIDHDHETGKVRGLLCNSCNLGLGFFKDDLHRVRAAGKYLEVNRVF